MSAKQMGVDLADSQTVRACIVCSSTSLVEFLDLGRTPLANKFLSAAELDEPEPTFPLRVGFCTGCGHVQLLEIVPPLDMFEDYLYVSAASDTLRDHLYDLARLMVERRGLTEADLVVDIGCNDMTLLQGFRRHGVRTLGVDPAKNLASLDEDGGIERYVGLFGSQSAREIAGRWGRASLITATNTFPHIPDLHDFLKGIDTVLMSNGAFVIEAHYLVDLLERGAFDTIYHEHVSYWTLGPMIHLFHQHGFEVIDAERLPLHHGQLRVTVQRAGERVPSAGVGQILELESRVGVDRLDTYRRFADKTLRIKTDLKRTLGELHDQGKRVVGYGAPAKGNTLISFLEIGPAEISYIVDRSPLKQGLFTPGSHIPIVPVERLLDDQPDYALLLAWNFSDEVLEQQAEYLRRGGRFILPVPEVRVV